MYVETGQEDEICKMIDSITVHSCFDIPYQLLVPKRQIYEKKSGMYKEVTKYLFPGYILIETERIDEFYYQVKNVPHIFRFLRMDHIFLQLQRDEMNQILYMTNDKGLIEVSNALYVNDLIYIIDGPLKGYEGSIRRIDKRKRRAKVEFQINKKAVYIDLGISIIYKK